MNFTEFLGVQNNSFVLNEKPVLLKSIGLGSWLNLEHMMAGIPGTHSQIMEAFTYVFGSEKSRLFWESFYTVGVTESDIAFVKSQGLNSVRIAVNHRLFFDHEKFEQTTAIRHIDRVLDYCAKHEIWAVIDLHSAPGGQNPDWHSDNNSGDYGFWKNSGYQEQMVGLWKQIAAYYKDSKVVAGYDLINEPCYFEKELDEALLRYSRESTKAIRSVDKNHIIFYEGNTYSRDFTMFAQNMDENCAYTFHFYPFLQIAELVDDESLSAVLEKQLNNDISLIHIQTVLKKPIWCGETGHPHHLHRTKFALSAFLKLLEAQNISWALWPYKDKGAMGFVHLGEQSGWNLKMNELSENWNFFDFFKQDSAVAIKQESDKMKYYRDMAEFATRGLEVFTANLKNTDFDALFNLIFEFRLENMVLNSFSMLNIEGN
jgi:endoglucanase